MEYTSNHDHDSELAAIVASSAAISKLADVEARRRVLSYVLARYFPEVAPTQGWSFTERELPGVAYLTDAGQLRITIRDLKARSRLDAAVRLASVAIYAHQRLAGRPLSSRRGLTPLLKEWRLYDGNTRAKLAKERGILRSGDDLSLDARAFRNAERLVEEIRSPAQEVESGRSAPSWGPELPEPDYRPPIAVRTPTFEHFENWDNFANKCSVCLHAVDAQGIILWANDTELACLGYSPEEYIGRYIGDFHIDKGVVQDVLERLIGGETVNAHPARMRAKDGSIRYVMLSSNVYRRKNGAFEHTRCFTTVIDEAAWTALKSLKLTGRLPRPVSPAGDQPETGPETARKQAGKGDT